MHLRLLGCRPPRLVPLTPVARAAGGKRQPPCQAATGCRAAPVHRGAGLFQPGAQKYAAARAQTWQWDMGKCCSAWSPLSQPCVCRAAPLCAMVPLHSFPGPFGWHLPARTVSPCAGRCPASWPSLPSLHTIILMNVQGIFCAVPSSMHPHKVYPHASCSGYAQEGR